MKTVLVTLLCLLAASCLLFAHVANSDCPPDEDIYPCICYDDVKHITCSEVDDNADLINAFHSLSGQSFEQLTIDSSALPFFPHEIFEDVKVREVHLYDSTFGELFDTPPTSLDSLEILQIEKCNFLRTNWNHLKHLTSLHELRIIDTKMRIVDEKFGRNLPNSLKYLILHRTETRTIKPGAFSGLDNIYRFEVTDTDLSNLERNIFPIPFNVEWLSFKENKLTSLSKGLFTRMPNLDYLDLGVNELTEVPEEAFEDTASQLDNLLLHDNPLRCDCGFKWLVSKGPKDMLGFCAGPAPMKGKALRQLTPDDFVMCR